MFRLSIRSNRQIKPLSLTNWQSPTQPIPVRTWSQIHESLHGEIQRQKKETALPPDLGPWPHSQQSMAVSWRLSKLFCPRSAHNKKQSSVLDPRANWDHRCQTIPRSSVWRSRAKKIKKACEGGVFEGGLGIVLYCYG